LSAEKRTSANARRALLCATHHQRRSASGRPCRRSGGWLGSESTCRLRYSRAALFVFGDEANASFTALDSFEIVLAS
jgi:hypothetical protein